MCYVVNWFVLYLTSVFDLILLIMGSVSMNDIDVSLDRRPQLPGLKDTGTCLLV